MKSCCCMFLKFECNKLSQLVHYVAQGPYLVSCGVSLQYDQVVTELHTEFTWRKIKLLSVYKEASLESPHMVIYVHCLVVQKTEWNLTKLGHTVITNTPVILFKIQYLYLSILFRITQIKFFVFGSLNIVAERTKHKCLVLLFRETAYATFVPSSFVIHTSHCFPQSLSNWLQFGLAGKMTFVSTDSAFQNHQCNKLSDCCMVS